jgi:NADPH-dependent F420 reductase
MRIAIVGGTGKEGRGLAVRLARAGHGVVIGSRAAERAIERAAALSQEHDVDLRGAANASACAQAELVVLSVPYSAHRSTLMGLSEQLAGKILVDITVPLRPPKVRVVHLPEGQSAALEARAMLPDTLVCATLHHVGSAYLQDVDHGVDCDVLVCGHKDARGIVVDLLAGAGFRALDAGPLRNAIALEALTPVLLYLNKRYGSDGTGIRITGLPE